MLEHILQSIRLERQRQDAKWGEQNHSPYGYLAILVEEVGELAEAILQTQFGGPHGGAENIYTEAIHVAAVAIAILECLQRNEWRDEELQLRSNYGPRSGGK